MMKHIYLATLFTFFSLFSFSQNQPFVTTWEVTNTSLGALIYIPTHPNLTYNYTVDFGDGTIVSQTDTAIHSYSSPGIYTVKITGTFPRIYFEDPTIPPFLNNEEKIKTIEQWGDIQWQSMNKAFFECSNLIVNATDTPNLSQVTDLSYMFTGINGFNQPINNWDVSNITNMSYLFRSVASFNQPLNNWDVSNVTNMEGMLGMTSFNQPIDNWDVSNVTNMSGMFAYSSFNQTINNWDVSNVTNMSGMFSETETFNQPLNNWDVSNVTNMAGMFSETETFNQPLNNWDVSNVTNMQSMFWGAEVYNQPLNSWNVSDVVDMESMFAHSKVFNQPLDNWDVSNVSNMSYMFYSDFFNSNYKTPFNQPLNNWDVSNVNTMEGMFNNSAYNQPLNNWDVSSVSTMEGMFFGSDFNLPIDNWNVSNVIDMGSMFAFSMFNQTINSWNVTNVVDMASLFAGAINFNQPLNNWNVSNVNSMNNMFSGNQLLSIKNPYNHPLNNWNVSNVTNFGNMFYFSSYNHPLSNWNLSNATVMEYMFSESDFNQPIYNWDVSNVVDMRNMFAQASDFNQDISFWNFNSNVSFGGVWTSSFLSNTSLDIKNYEKLLSRFVNLNLQNKFIGADNLMYCNTTSRDELINNLGWTIDGDSQSQNCNSIVGMIRLDESNNGCDPNDNGISGFMVNAYNGSEDLKTYSVNGNFEIGTLDSNFTVSVMNYPSYYSVTPASQQVTFTTSNNEVADFCVNANQTIEDLNVTLLPMSQARPGFEADYQLVIENIGTQTVANVMVTLDFDDAMQSFVNASVTPSTTTTNQLTFELSNLQPLTYQTIDLTMQTFQPPTVNGDDVLSFTAMVTPDTNDYTPNDNTFLYDQIVVNSYDPNDKQVLQGEEVEIKNADEYLDYLIRFQNTGTASAINVRILDTLHPKLDYSTLRPVNASHNYRIEITNDHEVEFIFEGINLPHESANEPASHGFVAYKIKPKSDVAVGDFITGDANIYFDFNAPIITNMVSTEMINNIVGTENPMANQIVIYPNPTQSVLNIETRNNQQIEAIKIYNLNGLELQTLKGNQKQLNVENLSSGVYFIKMTTNEGVITKRVLKN